MTPPDTSPAAVVTPLWFADLPAASQGQLVWLWHGYLAAGTVTLLTSQWKAGKTTLLSLLLHQMKSGGDLAGRPVQPGKVVVLSEESPDLWLERGRKFDYTGHVCWFCRPFRGKPSVAQWHGLLEQILTLHRAVHFRLVVIDPLAMFFPGRNENSVASMLEFLAPLQQLTAAGLAVLLLHHPRKHARADGLAPRGSSALPGFGDVLIEMHWYTSAADTDRRRRLLAWSRFAETPRQLVIELNAAATTYTVLGDLEQAALAELQPTLRQLLTDATEKLTCRQLLDRWPPDQSPPDANLLWRWLNRALAEGQVRRDGTGRKNDPYRYWLVEQDKQWRQDSISRLLLEQEELQQRLEREGSRCYRPS